MEPSTTTTHDTTMEPSTTSAPDTPLGQLINTVSTSIPKNTAGTDPLPHSAFWTCPSTTLIQTIGAEFPTQLSRLKRAKVNPLKNVPSPTTPSPSEILFGPGQDYGEVNRTLVGVLILRWIWNDEYRTLIGPGAGPVTLKRQSFDWLRSQYRHGIQTSSDLYTLVLSMVVNDVGKDVELPDEYARLHPGEDISHLNHDWVFEKAICAGMIPALERIPASHKDDFLRGIRLGSEFNFGQLAQGENVPACLAGLADMRGHKRAFEMRWMEQLLDLGGASGHGDWTYAMKLIEPIYQSYRNVYDVTMGIMHEGWSLRDGYDLVLTRRIELLREMGWERKLVVSDREARACMRLLCMSNAADKVVAEQVWKAFCFDDEVRAELTEWLNRDGTLWKPAVQPTYMPLMLQTVLQSQTKGSEEQVLAFVSALRYFAKVLVVTDEDRNKVGMDVIVVEKDVNSIREFLTSEEFKTNPEKIIECPMPVPGVAKRGKDDQVGVPAWLKTSDGLGNEL